MVIFVYLLRLLLIHETRLKRKSKTLNYFLYREFPYNTGTLTLYDHDSKSF